MFGKDIVSFTHASPGDLIGQTVRVAFSHRSKYQSRHGAGNMSESVTSFAIWVDFRIINVAYNRGPVISLEGGFFFVDPTQHDRAIFCRMFYGLSLYARLFVIWQSLILFEN